jgi:four helix bundle protein
MFKFEDLRVYQEGLKLVDLVYTLTNDWSKDETFGLTSQFRRAVVSIVLNLAEGTSRTKKDFRHFLDMARGSCYETVAIISIARQRGYITTEEFENIYGFCDKQAKTINALKRSLQ